ncbi:MAG: hypothetical protein ABI172_13585, partial [Ginsengibacter sp.]
TFLFFLKKKETKNSRKTRSLSRNSGFFHASSRQKPLAVICSHLTIFWTPGVATLKTGKQYGEKYLISAAGYCQSEKLSSALR